MIKLPDELSKLIIRRVVRVNLNKIPTVVWERVVRDFELSADEAIATLAMWSHKQTTHGSTKDCCQQAYLRIGQLTGGRLNPNRAEYRTSGALEAVRFYLSNSGTAEAVPATT